MRHAHPPAPPAAAGLPVAGGVVSVAAAAAALPATGSHHRPGGELALRLSGLYCAACAGIIEQALAGVEGVDEVVVNGTARRARVRFDDRRVEPQALIDAVRRAGYDAAPDHTAGARALRLAESRSALWRLFVAAFCAMQVMMLAAPAYVAGPGELAPDLQRLLDRSSLLFSVPVLLFSAAPFFGGAWRALRRRRIGMDVPVALGIVVTFVASSIAALHPGGALGDAVYFDSLTMFISFLLAGRWLELKMRHRAAEALEAATGTMPHTALRLDDGGAAVAVAVDELQPGDRVRVLAGQAFPADGALLEGSSQADEALLSGESKPVRKTPGCAVVGGSVNLGAPVVMRVERCGADTRYEAIVSLMRVAATQRPAAAQWGDRWAAPFLWAVLLLAAGAAAVWSVIDPSRAVWVAVSVLIVTCPCALSLATPSALLAAAQALARRGVLLRRIEALETLAGIHHLFLDKTGTLTTQRVALQRMQLLPGVPESERGGLWRRAAALAALSSHPLSRAIADSALPPGAAVVWHAAREQAGAGIEAHDEDGRLWRLGAAAWVSGEPEADDGENLAAWLGCDGRRLAHFAFEETLADGAAGAVAALQADGVVLTLLSGDSSARVQRLAARLGIGAGHAIGAATPEAKLQAVQQAQAAGQRVGMIGDGINDAPVLARADVSLAMGAGALVARSSADAVIVSDRLGDVVHARRLAQRMLRVIRQNMLWAAGYNAVCVPLALVGALPPWAAGLGMASSSLLVIGNSLRLQRRAEGPPGGI